MKTRIDRVKLSADETALVKSAIEGNLDQVQKLLARGVAVDARDSEPHTLGLEWNITALMCASAKGHLEIVRALLAGGASVSAASEAGNEDGGGGSQALHHALQRKHTAIAELLLDAGADPNAVGRYGRTPLTTAVHALSADGIRLMLKRGADAKLKPKGKGYTPPLVAAVSAINNTSSFARRDGKLVLEAEAIWEKKEEVLEMFDLLLAAGADPNVQNSTGDAALKALAHGEEMPDALRLPLVEAFLKAGATPDVANKDGYNALESAVQYSNAQVAKLLCQAGADYNRIFPGGTPLDLAELNVGRARKGLEQGSIPEALRTVLEKKLRRADELVGVLRGFGAKHKSELAVVA